MKPGNKYLLILVLAGAVGLGLLMFLGNSQPNVEVVVLNQSGQSLESIHLQTEKSAKNVVLRGVDVGAQVTVKFHNDGADIFSLMILIVLAVCGAPTSPSWVSRRHPADPARRDAPHQIHNGPARHRHTHRRVST